LQAVSLIWLGRDMKTAVLQSHLPYTPWLDPALRRLPGIQPVPVGAWLQFDDAYGAQLAEKKRLIGTRSSDVLALDPGAEAAAQELLFRVVEELRGQAGFVVSQEAVTRPDGVVVPLEPAHPLETLSQLVQEDFCILQKQGDEHVLTGALLCFPASWTLAEKFMQPLTLIHVPVDSYDGEMAKRVQRMFDMVRVDQPLWRANALFYIDPTLYQPRSIDDARDKPGTQTPYIRSERQTILRLPKSDALVFSIHTYLVLHESLTPAQAAALIEAPIETT